MNYINDELKIINLKEFRTKLIAKKYTLNSPQQIFSFNSAKIEFDPFQFRPLTKMLKSENNRILVADEVGVGKTIEAGIIIQEYIIRDKIKNIVIVCPKALVYKWELEMKKFGKKFTIIESGSMLKYYLNEARKDLGLSTKHSKLIISLELLRSTEIIESFKELLGILKFHMLIVDEVHHIVNSKSKSYEAIKLLSIISDIIVFLSATPIQLGIEDLYNLLRILSPEEFYDFELFQQMLEPNKYINNAIRIIKENKNEWEKECFIELSAIYNTFWAKTLFRDNKKLLNIINKLLSGKLISDEEQIKIIRDLEELHTLSHIINRTKRKEIGNFTKRETHTIKSYFTKEEREFYNKVIGLNKKIYEKIYKIHNGKKKYINFNFISSILERQLTSSIGAFNNFIEEFINKKLKSLSDFCEDVDMDEIEKEEFDLFFMPEVAEYIQEMKVLSDELVEKKKNASEQSDEKLFRDKKLENLECIINDTLTSEDDGKLIVFSYFKLTLNYLYDKLKEKARIQIMTGDISNKERNNIIKKFKKSKNEEDAIDVLLCSEVGCEGLDYQFCSRMVNYDIPWNPMKIEQRIGRIDRRGQKSEKIQIYNFIVEDTIEEKIFYRCFDRLKIFESALGNMDDVLGHLTKQLNKLVLNKELTDKDMEEKCKVLQLNAMRKFQEKEKFNNEKEDIYIINDEANEKIINYQKERIDKDLRLLICEYLKNKFRNIEINTEKNDLLITMDVDIKSEIIQELKNLKTGSKKLDIFLESNENTIKISFQNEDKNTLAINGQVNNPLLQLSINYLTKEKNIIYTSIKTKNEKLKNGTYCFAYYIFKEDNNLKTYFEIFLVNLETMEKQEISTIEMENILENSIFVSLEETYFEEHLSLLNKLVKDKIMNIQHKKDLEIEKRKLALEIFYQKKIGKIRNDMEQFAYDQRIKRMKEGEIKNLESKLIEKISNIKEFVDISADVYAIGWLKIEN